MEDMQADAQDYRSMFGLDRRYLNNGLTPARNATMLALLGLPRGNFDAECREVQNPALAMMLTTMDLGPFRATGLWHVLQPLARGFAELATRHPQIHARIGLAELACCRMVCGSAAIMSNHSWGAEIELTFDGGLDPALHPDIRPALMEVAHALIRQGFFWGAAYPSEDALHFEASEQLIRRLAHEGHFGPVPVGLPSGLTIGDRGIAVEVLQRALNRLLEPCALTIDAAFGPLTRAAVMEAQRRMGFRVDGIATAALSRRMTQVLARRDGVLKPPRR